MQAIWAPKADSRGTGHKLKDIVGYLDAAHFDVYKIGTRYGQTAPHDGTGLPTPFMSFLYSIGPIRLIQHALNVASPGVEGFNLPT